MPDPITDPVTPAAATSPNPPSVDVQAQVNAGIATFQSKFNAEFKAATGHEDLKAFSEAQLKAQGKLQELADANKAEALAYKTKFESAAINNALLAAAAEAVDPVIITDLLGSKAKVDEAGTVTIDGKPVTDAVKQLLIDKPFLAKAQGGTGSGAPQSTAASVKNPWLPDQHNITEQIRITEENPALAAQLKAAAGK